MCTARAPSTPFSFPHPLPQLTTFAQHPLYSGCIGRNLDNNVDNGGANETNDDDGDNGEVKGAK